MTTDLLRTAPRIVAATFREHPELWMQGDETDGVRVCAHGGIVRELVDRLDHVVQRPCSDDPRARQPRSEPHECPLTRPLLLGALRACLARATAGPDEV